ncbi:MAG: phosphatidylglycerophosphatase A, partial [Cetobacterium sp.]
MPVAPGTFGTLGGIPIYIGLVFLKSIFPNNMIYNSFYFMFLMTFFAISVYICDIAEREIFKEKDPQ